MLEDSRYQNLDNLREIPYSTLLLSLKRRQLQLDSRALLQDENSPEYKLLEYGVFAKMAESNLIYQDILFKMGYLKAKLPIGDRLKRILLNITQFIAGIFKVPRYIFFIFSKSRSNYIYFAVTVILLILILVNIFQWLGTYNKKKLANCEQQIESLK